MVQVFLSAAAEQDVEDILAWTHQRSGEEIRLRYQELLVQAILDLTQDPNRTGILDRPELAKRAFTYHLRFSRDPVNPKVGRTKQPRNFLLYRISEDGGLDIGRVLHESMDLKQHLPADDQAPDSESE